MPEPGAPPSRKCATPPPSYAPLASHAIVAEQHRPAARRRPGALLVTSAAGGPTTPFVAGSGAAPPASPQPPAPAPAAPAPPREVSAREARFVRALDAPDADLSQLRELAWNGVPAALRPTVWRLLAGESQPSAQRRAQQLARRRAEYHLLVARHYSAPAETRSEAEAATLRQIALDTPRTAPELPWVRCAAVAGALERLLFVRAVRSSAAGYVQGLADLTIPFLHVFLAERVCADVPDEAGAWAARLGAVLGGEAKTALADAEADTYWCTAFLLDGIQDNYTFAQLGIQRAVHTLSCLVRRLDAPLASRMEAQRVDCMQFAFRWANCLLQRELPPGAPAVRLWDAYLAEGEGGCGALLPFLMAALLLRHRQQLLQMDFQGMLLLLQHLPTAGWGEAEVSELLSTAHQHRTRFAGAVSHLAPP